MTGKYADSFSLYSTAQLGRRWDNYGVTGGNALQIGSYGRNGTGGANFGGGYSDRYMSRNFDNQQIAVIGAAFYFNSIPASMGFISLLDAGSYQVDLRITTMGVLQVTRNGTSLGVASSLQLLPSVWYFIEFKVKIDDTVGTVDVRVGGIDVAGLTGLTGLDTKATGNAYWNQLRLGSGGGSAYVIHSVCDLYVLDGQAGLNSFLGDIKVEGRLPSGAGNYAQFTPSAGSNYQCVDDNPANDDTDYVSTATAGNRDSYAMADLATTSGTVKGVIAHTIARKDDAGSRQIRQFLRVNAIDYDGAAKSISDSYVDFAEIWENNPNTGVAWTIGDVNGLEAGVKLEA